MSEPHCESDASNSLDRNSGDSNVMSSRSETSLHLEMPIFTFVVKNLHACFKEPF